MTAKNSPTTQPLERELTITRLFDAPRELVFEAWTDPKHLAHWWGAKDFTNPVCRADVHPGGALYIEMNDIDGSVYPVKGTFHEIVSLKLLVFTTSAFEDETGNPQLEALTTVTFEDEHGKTKLTLHIRLKRATPEVIWALDGMSEGWSESLDKLAAFLRLAS